MLCVAIFFASYLGFVLTGAGQRWDRDVFRRLSTETSTVVQDFSSWLLARIGCVPLLLGTTLGVLAIGFLRRIPRTGVLAAAVIPCSIGASRLLKVVVLDRPELGPEPELAHNTFPSGHVTAATATGLALLMVAPRTASPWLFAVDVVLAVLAGLAVVIAGWHRPSDAIGAAALAGAVYCSLALVVRAGRRVTTRAKHRRPRGRRSRASAASSAPLPRCRPAARTGSGS
ncbi:phosphatase PAP2 family protein [Amycolatopsis sp. CA-230715]|uniref:phosphatase PAP2 family protein n=1 Tax=Amycolatopsis sp. CA-230715 TaxID=2745196 RepID=UPI001C00B33B|nr:phosphatase PAP2 family protein [Amycolatopsis sp. CA-230715]QWF84341.1 hypothetical protein HUW46_07791 [Amycolatopsis sp. CA-230715]